MAPGPPQVAFRPSHINLCPGRLAEAVERAGHVPRAYRQSGCRVTPPTALAQEPQRAEGKLVSSHVPLDLAGPGEEVALTPVGHCCRSDGCLSSRSHSSPEQHSPPLFHQPALPKVSWGPSRQLSVTCVVIQQISCHGGNAAHRAPRSTVCP